MSSAIAYPHISTDANGTARIGNSRYKVLHLAAEQYGGWSADELLRQHPDLRPEEVYSALAYFYDHYEEMVERINENAAFAEAMRGKSPLTREGLLRRKKLEEPS
jgi:uncharacterized protein (DUF433 family)